MEMKLEEAQICRLCGECESIYIDVFGEEGTKRFLGVKIHTKINILIDETDPLPKAICVQCLGKLEFVCDFQEECLRTQQVLRERYNLPPLTDVINEADGLSHIVCIKCLGALEFLCDFHEQCHRTQAILAEAKRKSEKIAKNTPTPMEIDSESDKENSSPVKSSVKRKKQMNPETQKPAKIPNVMADKCFKANVQETDRSRVETNFKKFDNATLAINEDSKINKIEATKMSKPEDRKMDKNEDKKINKVPEIKITKIEETKNNKVPETSSNKIVDTKVNEIAGVKLTTHEETQRRNPEEDCVTKNEQLEANKIEQSRKTETNEPEVNDIKQMKKTKANEPEVNKSDLSKETEIVAPEVSKVEQRKEAKETESKINKMDQPKSSIIKHQQVTKIKQSKETEIKDPQVTKVFRPKSDKKKPEVQSIVKMEKIDKGDDALISSKEILKPNKIVWIPNILELPETENIKCTGVEGEEVSSVANKAAWMSSTPRMSEVDSPISRTFKSHEDSPPAGDEASTWSNETLFDKKKESASMGLPAKRILEKTREPSGRPKRETRMKKWKTEEAENDDADEDDEDGTSGSKKFGKITDLITTEQKEAIETFYVCDMSAVDERIVGDNLIFLDRKKFGCKLCDASYTRQDKCQVHIWGHLEMKPYRCTACEFSTVTVSNIRCHVRKSHLKIKPYACDVCNKRYVTAFLLEEHMNTHTGSRPYACDVCQFRSASRQVLSYHKTTHKPVKDITCNVCGKEFYSKGRLRAHLIIHNKDKAATMCKLCSIYLCNSDALQRHYANVHNKDYECNVCGKRCKSKKALNNHQNVHSAAKYKCTLCTNVYKSSHILKEHLLKHEGIRKYKCRVCQKDFAQQSHLAAHMAVHSDRRFCCPGCNRPFNRHDNMKMHTKRCDAFLANPELASALLMRKRSSKSPPKEEKKEIESENNASTTQNRSKMASKNTKEDIESENDTVSSPEPEYKKTDFREHEEHERSTETPNLQQSIDECETFTTIIVESTIPCT